MRRIIPALVSVFMLASCATPKYSYNFDYYDYNAGKKKAEKALIAESTETANASTDNEVSPLLLPEQERVATASADLTPTPVVSGTKTIGKKYTDLSKTEKKEFRKALKSEMKHYLKAKKSGKDGQVTNATKMMDHDLKLAIIFGAVALTLSFFGGVNSVFWVLSVVSLVIAVVFFVKWVVRQ